MFSGKKQIAFYDEFPDYILNNSIWENHLRFLKDPRSPSKRGAGYRFWKAALIEQHLSQMQDGDFLIYADSDLLNHLNWTAPLIASMEERNANLAVYQLPYEELHYCKRDVYVQYCPEKEQEKDHSRVYAAGFLAIRKAQGTTRFIKEWLQGVSNFHFIDDSPSKLPNIKEYIQHRHDQSILNLILKCCYKEPQAQIFTRPYVPPTQKSLDRRNPATVNPKTKVVTFQLPQS